MTALSLPRVTLWALLVTLASLSLPLAPARAQEAIGDVERAQEGAESLREASREQEEIERAAALQALVRPLGVVEEIEVTGLPSTQESVIRRQLTFDLGDQLTERHRQLSVKRLWQLGLFVHVEVSYSVLGEEPAEADEPHDPTAEAERELQPVLGDEDEVEEAGAEQTPEDAAELALEASDESPAAEPMEAAPEALEDFSGRRLHVKVVVYQPKNYYLYPTEFGGTIGERDFLGWGDNVAATVFLVDELEYYQLMYEDSQFGGGHHRAGYTALHYDSPISIRTELHSNTGDSYYLKKDGLKFRYQTTHNEDMQVWWSADAYVIDTSLRSGTFIRDKEFLLSGAEVPDGMLNYLSAGASQSERRGFPLINEGWYWDLRTEQSLELLGSVADFGKYRAEAGGYVPFDERGDALAGRIRLETSHGDLPHYAANTVAAYLRGYTDNEFFSRSTTLIQTELRLMITPEIGQVVLFYDLGGGFDDATPSFSDLDYGYGFGIRLRTGFFLPRDYLISADYAWGSHDQELIVGIGQAF